MQRGPVRKSGYSTEDLVGVNQGPLSPAILKVAVAGSLLQSEGLFPLTGGNPQRMFDFTEKLLQQSCGPFV